MMDWEKFKADKEATDLAWSKKMEEAKIAQQEEKIRLKEQERKDRIAAKAQKIEDMAKRREAKKVKRARIAQPKKCFKCKEEFTPNEKDQRFCSTECYKKSSTSDWVKIAVQSTSSICLGCKFNFQIGDIAWNNKSSYFLLCGGCMAKSPQEAEAKARHFKRLIDIESKYSETKYDGDLNDFNL